MTASDLRKSETHKGNDTIAIVAAVRHHRLPIDQENSDQNDFWQNFESAASASPLNFTPSINTHHDESIPASPIDPHFFECAAQGSAPIQHDIRMCLETIWHLLEAAGLTRESLSDNTRIRVGIFVSSAQKFPTDASTNEQITEDHAYQLQAQEIINHIARLLDVPTSHITTQTESPVSKNADQAAYQSLSNADCQLAIVIGTAIREKTSDENEVLHLNHSHAQRPWAVLLKQLTQAYDDADNIIAIIKPSQTSPSDKNKACVPPCPALEICPPPTIRVENPETTPVQNSPAIITLSANTHHALLIIASQLLDHVTKIDSTTSSNDISNNNFSLTDLAYTLQSCREAMNYRLAMVAKTFEDLSLGLAQYLLSEGHATAEAQKILNLARSTAPITLHRGDIKSNYQLQSLLSGSSGEAMIEALLLEGDLSNLALYWTQGGNIPWKSLYEGKSARKISLPTYPFYAAPQERPTAETGALLPSGEFGEQARQNMTTESVETLLIDIWKELLGSTQIGRHQNFFEIGGDSQLGMHMMSLVCDAVHVDLPLSYLYEAPTVAKMSEKITFMMALSSPSTGDEASAYQEYEEGIIL